MEIGMSGNTLPLSPPPHPGATAVKIKKKKSTDRNIFARNPLFSCVFQRNSKASARTRYNQLNTSSALIKAIS